MGIYVNREKNEPFACVLSWGVSEEKALCFGGKVWEK